MDLYSDRLALLIDPRAQCAATVDEQLKRWTAENYTPSDLDVAIDEFDGQDAIDIDPPRIAEWFSAWSTERGITPGRIFRCWCPRVAICYEVTGFVALRFSSAVDRCLFVLAGDLVCLNATQRHERFLGEMAEIEKQRRDHLALRINARLP